MSKDLVSDAGALTQQWLETVSHAIGTTPDALNQLIDTWLILGKSLQEMERRLIILAQLNGKRLVFSSTKNLS